MNYKKTFDECCQLLSLLLTFGELFVLLLVWVEAYFSLDKATIVYIDRFGEAFPELILWIVILPICIYGFYLNFRVIMNQYQRQ